MRTGHRQTTVYGTTMRSALEARWAIFFRELNLKWKYEPPPLYAGKRYYTPDFHVEGFGYIEIKPTLELLVSESSKRIAAVASANPSVMIYCFPADRVEIFTPVLFQGDKLFAPTAKHIYGLLSYARAGGDRLSVDAQDADIKRAMTIANTTKLGEWRGIGTVLQEVITGFIRNLEAQTT